MATNLKLTKSLLCLSVVSLATAAAFAQQATPASARTIVRAGKLLDVRTGKTLTNQAIVIEDGKIVSVGAGLGSNRRAAPKSSICRARLFSPA